MICPLLLEWRRDFAEQPIEFAAPTVARERDAAAVVHHVKSVRLQLRLHEPANVCLNQDQWSCAPADISNCLRSSRSSG